MTTTASMPQAAGVLKILQVSSWLREGGAERVALTLHHAFKAAGHDARLVVGGYAGTDPDRAIDEGGVSRMPNDEERGVWSRAWLGARDRLRPARSLASIANTVAEPGRALDRLRGREEFRFPGTRRLLELVPQTPDVIHCHNLHGGYFDLRFLPRLTKRVPVFLTLHDHWLLGGHCAYPFECERWTNGCGSCPHLDTYPSLDRDGTAANWRRKAEIYRDSRVYIAAPCRWLIDRVERSMLAPAVVESRVIPYGVDTDVFRPAADRAAVRRLLGLPVDGDVLLYAANRLGRNQFKDFATLKAAVTRVANAPSRRVGRSLTFVALGDAGLSERIGDDAELRFVPFEEDPRQVALYYQSADVFLHAARADNFPNTILEALACGTPVVATDVGGINEQVRDIEHPDPTGALAPGGDAAGLARATLAILSNESLRRQLSENARVDALTRFTLVAQRDAYIQWFAEAIASHSQGKGTA